MPARLLAVALAALFLTPLAAAQGTVKDFILVDVEENEDISDFGDGTLLATDDLPPYTIRVEVDPVTAGSVEFVLRDSTGTVVRREVDNVNPFTLGGDDAGDFTPIDIDPGSYTLTATPYTRRDAAGDPGTALSVSFRVTDQEGVKAEIESGVEAESEGESESEVEGETTDGRAAAALAVGGAAAASGGNALVETASSGSMSMATEKDPADRADEPSGRVASGPAVLAGIRALPSAEAESESEVESGALAEANNGSAVAVAGTSAAASAVGANVVLNGDGTITAIPGDTETSTVAMSSTSTSTAEIEIEYFGDSDLRPAPATPVVLGGLVADPVLQVDTEAEVESEVEVEAETDATPGAAAAAATGGTAVSSAGDFPSALSDVSVATSAIAAEVEERRPALFTEGGRGQDLDPDESEGRIASAYAVAPLRTSRPAACVACGFGEDEADKVSELTFRYEGQAGTVRVFNDKDRKFDELLFERELNPGDTFTIRASTLDEDELNKEISVFVDGAAVAQLKVDCSKRFGPGTTEQNQEDARDPNGAVDVTVTDGKDKDGASLCALPGTDGGAGPTADPGPVPGKGLFEAESESEAEAEAEAEAGNNAGAAAAAASGGGGSTGLGGTTQAAASTTTSASGGDEEAEMVRANDLTDRSRDRFTGEPVEGAEAEADVETDTEAEAEQSFGASATATPSASGEAAATSRITIAGEVQDGDEMSTEPREERRAPLAVREARRPLADSYVLASHYRMAGNLETETESEAEAEAEAETDFESAAAAAAAVGVQAENGLLPAPADAAAGTSTSTSVGKGNEVHRFELIAPGPAEEGERGGLVRPVLDLSDIAFEVATEAEAEAEVGFQSGAAAAVAVGSGRDDMLADTRVATTPFAAAAAAAAGPTITLSVSIPRDDDAGPVVATATASDPMCKGVAVAVAVAGVPVESGRDNEAEDEAEEPCAASLRVEVQTDPADAESRNELADPEDPEVPEEEFQAPPPNAGGLTISSEAVAEAEAEAEADYGTAAAAAAGAASGRRPTVSVKTSTSSDEYEGPYEFGDESNARVASLAGVAETDGAVMLTWEGPATADFRIAYRNGDTAESIGEVVGVSAEGGVRTYEFRTAPLGVGLHRLRVEMLGEAEAEANARLRVVAFAEVDVDVVTDQPILLHGVRPNPVRDRGQLAVAVAETGPVTVGVYDVLGRRVRTLFSGVVEGGTLQPVVFDARSLSSGVYVIRAQTSVYIQSAQVTVAR